MSATAAISIVGGEVMEGAERRTEEWDRNHTSIRSANDEKHDDFRKTSQGKMYRPADKLRIPVYLDRDLERRPTSARQGTRDNLSQIVNAILRKEIEVAEMLQS
jgi:hypothetical protein